LKPPIALLLIGGLLLAIAGTIDNSPASRKQSSLDAAGTAFRKYESAWRDAQKGLAERLERGEITSESDASKWFGSANAAAMKAAFQPLVETEYEAFGGDKWTAQSQAKFIRGYVNE